MSERDLLARRFEDHRDRLKAVAYQMLGSPSEAEDAVQEAWLRLSRSGTAAIDNLGGWSTTVIGRVCMDLLRRRRWRREGPRQPDPAITSEGADADPERRALLTDPVGLPLLESLSPRQRLAFVLHDMFGLSFDEIARIVDRTPVATRKLASRARARVRGRTPRPEPDRVTALGHVGRSGVSRSNRSGGRWLPPDSTERAG